MKREKILRNFEMCALMFEFFLISIRSSSLSLRPIGFGLSNLTNPTFIDCSLLRKVRVFNNNCVEGKNNNIVSDHCHR